MYSRILVPLDGSTLSECSLVHVINIIQGNPGIEVVLLTVREEVIPLSSISFSESKAKEFAVQREKMEEEARLKIEEYLTNTAAILGREGISVRTVLLPPEQSKTIPETIMDYAKEAQADLIVMSTHGRSGISRWAFGSVADRVVHYSKIPVLTIAPAQCRV